MMQVEAAMAEADGDMAEAAALTREVELRKIAYSLQQTGNFSAAEAATLAEQQVAAEEQIVAQKEAQAALNEQLVAQEAALQAEQESQAAAGAERVYGPRSRYAMVLKNFVDTNTAMLADRPLRR